VEKDVNLTDTLLSDFTSAADVHEVNLTIKAAFTDNDHDADHDDEHDADEHADEENGVL
jgi:hypothetical protein